MKKIILLLIISFPLFSFSGGKIKIKEAVGLKNSKNIYLSDLFELEDLNKHGLFDRLNKVKLGSMPELGENKAFSQQAISQYLRRSLSSSLRKKLKIHIPNNITVYRVKKLFTQPTVRRNILEQWKSNCKDCDFQWVSLILPTTKPIVDWTVDANKVIPRGYFTMQVSVTTLEGEKRNYWVSGQIKVFKKVAQLKRNIGFQQRVQPDDVEIIRKEVTFLNKNTALPSDLVGQKLTRPHGAGEVLFLSSIQREKALKQGDFVSVKVGNSLWSVTMAALAQQSGFIGDTIKLKNMESGKIFSARITGKGEAIIE